MQFFNNALSDTNYLVSRLYAIISDLYYLRELVIHPSVSISYEWFVNSPYDKTTGYSNHVDESVSRPWETE